MKIYNKIFEELVVFYEKFIQKNISTGEEEEDEDNKDREFDIEKFKQQYNFQQQHIIVQELGVFFKIKVAEFVKNEKEAILNIPQQMEEDLNDLSRLL